MVDDAVRDTADRLHRSFCMEDHGAMHCLYGHMSPGGIQDTKKWYANAEIVVDFAWKHHVRFSDLTDMIVKLGIGRKIREQGP